MKLQRDSRITTKFISIKDFLWIFGVMVIVNGWHMFLYVELSRAFAHNSSILVPSLITYIVVMSALLAIVYAIIRDKVFNKPLRILSKAAKNVADGDFSVYIKHSRKDGKKGYAEVLYEDFNKMVEELGSIETLKNDFTANVSHELKTPLSIIRNYAGALKKEDISPEERNEYIDTIISASDNLTSLVSNILKLGQLENQEILPISEPYDLYTQLSEIAFALEKTLEERHIELEVDIEDRVTLKFDPGMIELIWHNLLANAVKFTGVGGKITLTQTVNEDSVTVSVSDTGCGMDTETLKRIFDKFYQGDTSHSGAGNGLGLALVKRVLDLVGGSIIVQSEVGTGSTFTVILTI